MGIILNEDALGERINVYLNAGESFTWVKVEHTSYTGSIETNPERSPLCKTTNGTAA